MTDKVQKIREEVERLKGWNNNVRNSTRHMTLQEEDFNRGKHSSYLEILNFIDSLQEESVSEQKLSNVERTVKDWKESVSEELDEVAKNIRDRLYLEEGKRDEFGNPYFLQNTILKAVIMGAQWQKQQFEKDYTDLCNGIATAKGIAVTMAYDKGMADAKEQLMKDATEVTVHIEAGNYPYIPQIELYDYDKDVPLAKAGDMYKVVLIKEE